MYLHQSCSHLSQLNRRFIEAICAYLSIETRISSSGDYRLVEGQTERLAGLCEQAGATEYISGPAARTYVDERIFIEKGIGLSWFDYDGYVEYPQLWGEFVHGVSILDLLFNCGKRAPNYMRYARKVA
jgi:hypothetical protein